MHKLIIAIASSTTLQISAKLHKLLPLNYQYIPQVIRYVCRFMMWEKLTQVVISLWSKSYTCTVLHPS